jgi:hypothetical protein
MSTAKWLKFCIATPNFLQKYVKKTKAQNFRAKKKRLKRETFERLSFGSSRKFRTFAAVLHKD